MASDNLLDVVDELRQLVGELRRLMYGDTATRSSGLIADFERHERRITALEAEVVRLKNRKPIVGMWIGGFVAFVTAIILTAIGFINAVTPANMLDMSPLLSLSLAGCLTVVSLVMFLGGFGWLTSR